MRVFFALFLSLIVTVMHAHDSYAAFVQYRDENGGVHVVNTDYNKVPDRYKSQVAAQLKAIEEKENPPAAAIKPASTISSNSSMVNKKINAQLPIIDVTPAVPINDTNRLERLNAVMTELQVTGYFPPSINPDKGVLSYVNKQGRKITVTRNTVTQVPKEFLPQIDSKIISLEHLAKRSSQSNPFIPGQTVEVFTKNSCEDCVRLLVLLDVSKIRYLNYDVNNTPQGIAFYKSVGNKAALPITKVKGIFIKGSDIAAIKKAFMGTDNSTATSSEDTSEAIVIPPSETAPAGSVTQKKKSMAESVERIPVNRSPVNHYNTGRNQ